MKKIEAILRPSGFGEMEKILKEVGYPGVTPETEKEYEETKSLSWHWGQLDFKVRFLPELKLEIEGPDMVVEKVAKAVAQRPKTAA